MIIHGLIMGSRVNGPGVRAVIYFQGCTLGCRHCWNPDTHRFSGAERRRSAAEIADSVIVAHEACPLDGVTFSGGEPMQQADGLLALIESLGSRSPWLSFGMYSGYSEQELACGLYWCRSELSQDARQQIWRSIRSHLDFAVLGRYVAARPSTLPLRSSSNQKLALFSNRYREEDFDAQEVEVQIDVQGVIQVTGFPTAGIPA
jgi:anaerobic ribonucleoside-triphosphate reductase activating protein